MRPMAGQTPTADRHVSFPLSTVFEWYTSGVQWVADAEMTMITTNKPPVLKRRRWLSSSLAAAIAVAASFSVESVCAQSTASKQLQTFIDTYADDSKRSTRSSFSAQSFE